MYDSGVLSLRLFAKEIFIDFRVIRVWRLLILIVSEFDMENSSHKNMSNHTAKQARFF